MKQAHCNLYRDGASYSLAIYCGGLAVECLLRAFRWKEDSTFEGRHDLTELLADSRLLKVHDDFLRHRRVSEDEILTSAESIRAAMNEVTLLWHNNLRFASEKSLTAYLKRIGRAHGIKGNPCKRNAFDMLDAAQRVMNRGVQLWTS